jgi:hypothetical protein
MQTPLYDNYTGQQTGSVDIPIEVFTAAALVYAWMRTNDCSVLNGLRLESKRGWGAFR